MRTAYTDEHMRRMRDNKQLARYRLGHSIPDWNQRHRTTRSSLKPFGQCILFENVSRLCAIIYEEREIGPIISVYYYGQ